MGTLALSAQTAVLKEIEQALNENNYEYVVSRIKPALSDPSTAELAQTWYLAGKANFGLYDQFYTYETLGNTLSADDKWKAGHAIINGYKSFFKAITIETGPDAKGKSKYTKEMLRTMKDNYAQLKNAGVFLFEAQDYKGAYDAWEIYVGLPTNRLLGKDAPNADTDDVVGNMMYYQLLAALSANMNAEAFAKVAQIEKTGYQNMDVYVYGIEAARRLNDTIAMAQLAQKGYDIYGTQNIQFIGELINQKLSENDFAGCQGLCKKAIAATNDDKLKSQLYDVLGIVYEQQDEVDKALNCFDKAIELDPENAKNYYDQARVIYNKVVKYDESDETRYKVVPLLQVAATLFETAYNLDSENLTTVPDILKTIYSRLNDEKMSDIDVYENGGSFMASIESRDSEVNPSKSAGNSSESNNRSSANNYKTHKNTSKWNSGDEDSSYEKQSKNVVDSKDSFNRSSEKNYYTNRETPNRDYDKGGSSYVASGLSDVDEGIPTSSISSENTFALIIANENYQEVIPVDFAHNDGRVFSEYCKNTLGLPEANIHLVKDATLNNIRREINLFKKIAEAYKGDASIIVYYAGHGIPDESSGLSYLLPIDGYGSDVSTCYSLNDLYKTLGDMPSQQVVVLLDACFSGSVRGNNMLASARGVAIKAKPGIPKGKMVVISAAQSDESAYAYKDRSHGLFSYYLLKKLKESNGKASLGELSSYIKEQVLKRSLVINGKSQTPSVNVSSELNQEWTDWKLYR